MQFKKLVAGALGALMVGATAGLSATLADYPAPFAKDGTVNSVIVVGDNVASADVVGATNLGIRLASESYKLTTAGVTSGTVSGGTVYSKDVPFNYNVSAANQFKTPLKTADVTALKSGSISFDSSTYNWEESVSVTNFTAGSNTQVEVSANNDKSLAGNPYLFYSAKDIAYNLSFTQTIDTTKVSESKPLTLTILGKSFKITRFGTGNFTATLADEKFMKINDSFTETGGKKVTLKDVATSVAVVDVDGETKTISSGSTETVNGVQVKVVSVVYHSNNVGASSATLQAGTDITKQYNNDDEFVGENKDNPNWRWDLSGVTNSTTATPRIRVYNARQSATAVGVTDAPQPIGVGQSLAFPNNYVKLGVDSVTGVNRADFTVQYLSASDRDQSIQGAAFPAVVKISTATNDGITVTAASNAKAKILYIIANGSTAAGTLGGVNVTYVDSNNKVVSAANNTGLNVSKIADLVFQDTSLPVHWQGTDNANNFVGRLNVTEDSDLSGPSVGNVTIQLNHTSGAFSGMNTVNQADADDLKVYGTQIGTREEDVLTNYGILIKTPKTNTASDKVVLSVPSSQVKAFLSLKAGSTSTTNTSSSGTVKEVNPITAPIAKLVKDATADRENKNIILVGGPCANTMVAELAAKGALQRAGANGTKTDLTCNNWVAMKDNFGVIAVVNDAFKTGFAALVVAGSGADETRLGTEILMKYDTYKTQLTGGLVEFSGANLAGVKFA